MGDESGRALATSAMYSAMSYYRQYSAGDPASPWGDLVISMILAVDDGDFNITEDFGSEEYALLLEIGAAYEMEEEHKAQWGDYALWPHEELREILRERRWDRGERDDGRPKSAEEDNAHGEE